MSEFLVKFANQVQANITPMITRRGDTWDAWSVALRAACMRDSKVLPALQANPNDGLLALIKCANLGLSPDPGLQHFALVPFKGKLEGMIMWRGWLHVAMRTGKVHSIDAEVVYRQEMEARDQSKPFRDAMTGVIDHNYDPFRRDGYEDKDIVGAYAWCQLVGGKVESHVMSRGQIEKRRRLGADGPAWRQWYAEMCKAKVLKAFLTSGKVPLTREDQKAIEKDDTDDRQPVPVVARVLPTEPRLPPPKKLPSGHQVLFDLMDKNPMPSDEDRQLFFRQACEAAIAAQQMTPEDVAEVLGQVAQGVTSLDQLATEELSALLDGLEPQ